MDAREYCELELIEPSMSPINDESAPIPNQEESLVSIEQMLNNCNTSPVQLKSQQRMSFEIARNHFNRLNPLQKLYIKAVYYGIGPKYLKYLRTGINTGVIRWLATLPDVKIEPTGGSYR